MFPHTLRSSTKTRIAAWFLTIPSFTSWQGFGLPVLLSSVHNLLWLLSPIFSIVKAVGSPPGSSARSIPGSTHPHTHPLLYPLSPFGVGHRCYWGRGGGKGNEVFLFCCGIPSHPFRCWGGRVLIAFFCHATQHSVIQAKNFG